MACIRRVTPDGATDLGPLLTSGGPQQKDIFGKIMDIVIDLVDIICEIMVGLLYSSSTMKAPYGYSEY